MNLIPNVYGTWLCTKKAIEMPNKYGEVANYHGMWWSEEESHHLQCHAYKNNLYFII